MGATISSFFQTGGHLLSPGVSDSTKTVVLALLEELRQHEDSESHIHWSTIEGFLVNIPKGENILAVNGPDGYNLLQRAIGFNCVELARWIVNRGCDVNRGACSLPLHIASLHGAEEIVEILMKHGARVDLESRMCFPGIHNSNCELRSSVPSPDSPDRASEKMQSAEYYAIDGDRVNILEILLAQSEDNWLPWQQKHPLLHLACERAAWNCARFLVAERYDEVNQCYDEVNQCYDEYYPIHKAALQDIKFLNLLLRYGADVTVRTATQQMTVLHVVLLLGKKSAEDTMATLKVLLDQGCRELINEPDILGNTPLHALIARYALEEQHYGYDHDPPPWNKWDMLHLMRYFIQNEASSSINQKGNSALACVLRHVRDWEFRYELLEMLLQNGGDPNIAGRDGSAPLMVCLVPLINMDPLDGLKHTKKVFYLNSVRLLCQYGANPNCCASRGNMTLLQILVYTASEYIIINREEEKANAFAFIRQLLVVLLQHGMDPNVNFSQRTPHTLYALMEMVNKARKPSDLDYVYQLTLTLLQYGADPNVGICTTEPMICQSQSSVFLKRPSSQVLYYYVQLLFRNKELLVDKEQRFDRLILLYYNAMRSKELYSCLKILNTQINLVPMGESVDTLIRKLYSNPRTLQQLSRIAIYNALNYKLAPNVNKLPLPPLMREYLLEWNLQPNYYKPLKPS